MDDATEQQFQAEVMDELKKIESEREEWLSDSEAQAEYQEYLNSKEHQYEVV